MDEVKELTARIEVAENPLTDSEPMRRAEAVRNVLGRVYLHFKSVKKARYWRSQLLPEKTEFESATAASQSRR
jgi:hypothetical protein